MLPAQEIAGFLTSSIATATYLFVVLFEGQEQFFLLEELTEFRYLIGEVGYLMRKVLEITALVLGIVASLVAIIVFLSGRNSLPTLISTSPTLTPTTVSSSISTSTASTSTVNEIQSDYIYIVLGDKGPYAGIAIILQAVLFIEVIVLVIPRRTLWKLTSCSLTLQWILMLLGIVGVMPFLIPYLIYGLLEMSFTSPLYLILCTDLIAYIICLFIAYVFKRWEISLE